MFPGSFETSINPQEWEGYNNAEKEEQFMMKENEAVKIDLWLSELSSFQKLILIKCCKEEKVSCLFNLNNCVITISTKVYQLVMIHELIRFV